MQEVKEAGVFGNTNSNRSRFGNNLFITRLHVRYDRANFPEDLKFQATSNQQLFQGRYVIRHPFREKMSCKAANDYLKQTRERQEKEAHTLAKLTGWNLFDIQEKIKFVKAGSSTPWWRQLWK